MVVKAYDGAQCKMVSHTMGSLEVIISDHSSAAGRATLVAKTI